MDDITISNWLFERNTPDENLSELSKKELLLPVMLSKYKAKDEFTISKATNQMRTYLVSALMYLAALRIPDEPVFGLVVNGTHGAVMMAWKRMRYALLLFRITEKLTSDVENLYDRAKCATL